MKSTMTSAFGQAHQQPVSVHGCDVRRRGEETALVPDLPDLDAGDLIEVENQEAGLAAVEEPEAVAALLDVQERPRVPLTMTMLPKNSGFQIGENSPVGM